MANWVDMKLSPAEVEFYLTRAKSKVVLVFRTNFPKKVYANRGHAPAEHFVVLPLAPYLTPELGRKPVGVWEGEKGPMCLRKEFLPRYRGICSESARWEEPVAITYRWEQQARPRV